MKNITRCAFAQVAHLLILFSFLTLALLGRVPSSQAGWIACPPESRLVSSPVRPRERQRAAGPALTERLRCCGHYLARSWPRPLLSSLLGGLLWWSSGCLTPVWLLLVPILAWLWQAAIVGWSGWGQHALGRLFGWLLLQVQLGMPAALLGLSVSRWVQGGIPALVRSLAQERDPSFALLGLGCALCGQEGPHVEVQRSADGDYETTLCGHFTLRVSGDNPFRVRMLLLFLRMLDVPGQQRGSRRTREGRSPFVRQKHLAESFGCTQPEISRWEGYWQRGDWPNLLSLCTPEVLSAELIRRIVRVCATFPQWGQEQVCAYLQGQGARVTERQVRQAMEQSGWLSLRQELRRRFHWSAEQFSPREEFLLGELLRLNQSLLERLEQGQGLPREERVALTDLHAQVQELGLAPPAPLKARPWLLRVEGGLFGQGQPLEDDTIRCPQCGSQEIGRKSRQPRRKTFYDAQGELREVEVYRYYCRNRACSRKSFTHLPPGLVPYSRHRLEVHTLALQAYGWSYSTYRRVGQALRVSEGTVYRWVSAWGQQLLPVAALFGLVRSSGVVGVDEKYVLVPKNDKPAGKMRRWMYVYLAVDVHTYDLLHIALYPHNTSASARAFLLVLRAKGYHPRVIVTDLRRDYGAVIAQVFAQAQHHECIFHAEQGIGHYFRETWGRGYAQEHPEAVELHEAVKRILRVRTKRTAQKRYEALHARRKEVVQASPPLQGVFDFLEQHWEHLVDAIESELVPRTNNAVEMVIRRFDQHYHSFCGFESIRTAQVYLGVFEKLYRFTPFSDDARPEIRGKSPLELAGYDLSQMSMSWLCRGYSLEWPIMQEAQDADVPSA